VTNEENMGLKNFILKFAGRKAARELDLKEGPVENKKKWYQSKSILNGILIALFGSYELARANVAPHFGWTLPEVPGWVYTFLGAMGIYSRVVAEKKIG
jgi:hypothetical protein